VASFDEAIPPGGVGEITLKVDTDGYQGKVNKRALVQTNDPDHPREKIFLTVNVRPQIVVEPSPRIFLHGVAGDEISETVHLKRSDGQALEISHVETNLKEAITYELTPGKKGVDYDLKVSSKVDRRDVARGYLKLFTNHPKKKELQLPVRLQVQDEFEVWPKRLIFKWKPKSGKKDTYLKRKLILVNNRKRDFRLQDLQYNQEYFQIRILGEANKIASTYQLEVMPKVSRLPEDRLRVNDVLIIKTDAAKGHELKVPLSILTKN
jgi:hypothetical protein